PALDGPYQLKYKTKLAERVVGENVKVNNTVDWNDKEEPADKEVSPNVGWKDHKVDYSNQTITWTVEYNTDKQKMTNTKITDTIQQGMELIGGVESIKVINPDNNGEVVENSEIAYDESTKTITVIIPG